MQIRDVLGSMFSDKAAFILSEVRCFQIKQHSSCLKLRAASRRLVAQGATLKVAPGM
jgi:hypothetical protein